MWVVFVRFFSCLLPFIDATQHPRNPFILVHRRIVMPRITHWPQKSISSIWKTWLLSKSHSWSLRVSETALSASKCEKISLTATMSLKILDSSIEMGVGVKRFFVLTLVLLMIGNSFAGSIWRELLQYFILLCKLVELPAFLNPIFSWSCFHVCFFGNVLSFSQWNRRL